MVKTSTAEKMQGKLVLVKARKSDEVTSTVNCFSVQEKRGEDQGQSSGSYPGGAATKDPE